MSLALLLATQNAVLMNDALNVARQSERLLHVKSIAVAFSKRRVFGVLTLRQVRVITKHCSRGRYVDQKCFLQTRQELWRCSAGSLRGWHSGC